MDFCQKLCSIMLINLVWFCPMDLHCEHLLYLYHPFGVVCPIGLLSGAKLYLVFVHLNDLLKQLVCAPTCDERE